MQTAFTFFFLSLLDRFSQNKKESKQPVQMQNQTVSNGLPAAQTWPHLKYDFLQPDKIRDKQRRTPKDPDYDPKTVFVPTDFLNNQTPVRILAIIFILRSCVC